MMEASGQVKGGGKKKKKQKGIKVSLEEFHGGALPSYTKSASSWADETENTVVDTTARWNIEPAIDVSKLPKGPRAAYEPTGIDPSRLPRGPPYTAYIGNLSYDVEEEDLREFFHNDNLNIRLPTEGSRIKGFGYVEFESVTALAEGLTLDGTTLKNRRIRVDLADDKDGDGRSHMDDRTDGDWRAAPSRDSFGGDRDNGFGHRGGDDRFDSRRGDDRDDRFDSTRGASRADDGVWRRAGPPQDGPPRDGPPRDGPPRDDFGATGGSSWRNNDRAGPSAGRRPGDDGYCSRDFPPRDRNEPPRRGDSQVENGNGRPRSSQPRDDDDRKSDERDSRPDDRRDGRDADTGDRHMDRGPERSDGRGPDRSDDRQGSRHSDRGHDDRGPDRYDDRRGGRYSDRGRYDDSGSRNSGPPRYDDQGRGGGRYGDREPERFDGPRRDDRYDDRGQGRYGDRDGGRDGSRYDDRDRNNGGGSSWRSEGRGGREPPQDGSPSKPAERPRLNLQKRSKPIEDTGSSSSGASAIFGGAKPVDTAAKVRQIEERREQEAAKPKEERTERRSSRPSDRPDKPSWREAPRSDGGRDEVSASGSQEAVSKPPPAGGEEAASQPPTGSQDEEGDGWQEAGTKRAPTGRGSGGASRGGGPRDRRVERGSRSSNDARSDEAGASPVSADPPAKAAWGSAAAGSSSSQTRPAPVVKDERKEWTHKNAFDTLGAEDN